LTVKERVKQQLRDPFLFRDVALSKTHIAFAYGGNIWVAERSGENLRRLTTAGREALPAFSPDGGRIAFAAEYDGFRGVYTVPTQGGEPQRITHHPADLGGTSPLKTREMLGWTPDGARIVFSSRRAAFAGSPCAFQQLLTVPSDGGCVTSLPLERASQGSFSPDGARIAYVPNVQTQREWKRYRGGQTTPIWIAKLADSQIEARIPRHNSNDFNPMWIAEEIYFLSDRDGPVTLFSYALSSQRVKRTIDNDGFDIKCAAASSDAILYEQFGSLHLLDLSSGTSRTLDILPTADFPEPRPRFHTVADRCGAACKPKLSPTGARAVFGVSGTIFTVPAEQGDIRTFAQDQCAVARDPAWSPDGRSIAYFSDESGEYALHIRDVQRPDEPVRKIDLGPQPTYYYSPRWSPDSSKIGYVDKQLNYWYVDLKEGVPVLVDTDRFANFDPVRDLQFAWSPDGRWMAYIKQLESYLHAIFIYSLEEERSYQLTDGMSDVRHVAFDRKGQYLYFTASTDTGLSTGWDMATFLRPVTRAVYAMLLSKATASPTAPQKDEELTSVASQNMRQVVHIDFDDLHRRIVPLPVPARAYVGLVTGREGSIFLLEGQVVEEPRGGSPVLQVHLFDLESRKMQRLLESVLYFDLSFDGEEMLYGKYDDARKVQWFIASVEQTGADPSGSTCRNPLKLDCMQVFVDPRAHWRHMFDEAWRDQRDFFYDPGLHGVELEQIKHRYRPFLHHIVSRDDLDYLFNEMLANLTVGHQDAWGPDFYKSKRFGVGLLGADYAAVNGRYRFTRIYGADPWNPNGRAPLAEPGMNVMAGEYLLAVDGCDIDVSVDVYSHFENTAGKQLRLKVGASPDGEGARELLVVPVEDEYELRHFAWVEENRRTVNELTDGRVAYIYVPDCAYAGYKAFNRYFFAQIGKEAAIIDGRYNAGGSAPGYLIDCLSRPLLNHWHTREGRDTTSPMLGIFGPKVMIINEMACSCGEALPWMFRRIGLGPLVGKRTWGGLVGHHLLPPEFADGGGVCAPNLAFYSPDGEWDVENRGVSPDFEIEDDPSAARSGHDLQLEKAVEVVMGLLNNNPRPTATRPAFPRYWDTE